MQLISARSSTRVKAVGGARARSEPGGTRWRTGGEVKGKLANGVGSQYSHATSERGLSSITQADTHTSAASSRLNWRPHRFKWIRPFREKTKSGFCACAITFRTSYTTSPLHILTKRRNNFACHSWNIHFRPQISPKIEPKPSGWMWLLCKKELMHPCLSEIRFIYPKDCPPCYYSLEGMNSDKKEENLQSRCYFMELYIP